MEQAQDPAKVVPRRRRAAKTVYQEWLTKGPLPGLEVATHVDQPSSSMSTLPAPVPQAQSSKEMTPQSPRQTGKWKTTTTSPEFNNDNFPALGTVVKTNENGDKINAPTKRGTAGTFEYLITVIYGYNSMEQRKALWADLTDVAQGVTLPWLICGDFNSVLLPDDRLYGNPGEYYTWSNKQSGADRNLSRIDRAFSNHDWMMLWGHVTLKYDLPNISYHAPMILNAEEFRGLKLRIVHAMQELAEIQKQIDTHVDDVLLQQEKTALQNLEKWSLLKESALKQKSRTKWIHLGDGNSKYFYAVIKERNQRKKIVEINSLTGNKLTEPTEIKTEILQFYKSLMVTDAEIVKGRQSIGDDKSPGIDGFNSVFLKKAWPVIKTDILKSVESFFTTEKLYQAINCTAVTLVPKTPKPATVKEFQPIACCTILYKLIALGLQANLGKSSVYFGGTKQEVQDSILSLLGYSCGELPFKFLEVPLYTKKLTMVRWLPLIEKITAKISTWTAKKLSYVGRLQLVQVVIFGIQAYRSQMFIIPSKVLKAIESYCRSYVWSGTNIITKKALMAWERVCTPKSAGGLNLTNLQLWNKAAIAETCWDLEHKQDKLWIRWIHAFYIKEQQFHEAKPPQQGCWIVRKILEARVLTEQIQHNNFTGKSIIRHIYLQLHGSCQRPL
ncbi:uncharacterized protein LOC132601275 [Lycium barbarum]|uniref:uncharacterized protein LOC132601275 n=1 Tax=Lycium barbarum TaxID=112863 RepID=UPI00293F166B|nr:uncharacterized protein LOC132601275 [Lycium barbarum]